MNCGTRLQGKCNERSRTYHQEHSNPNFSILMLTKNEIFTNCCYNICHILQNGHHGNVYVLQTETINQKILSSHITHHWTYYSVDSHIISSTTTVLFFGQFGVRSTSFQYGLQAQYITGLIKQTGSIKQKPLYLATSFLFTVINSTV